MSSDLHGSNGSAKSLEIGLRPSVPVYVKVVDPNNLRASTTGQKVADSSASSVSSCTVDYEFDVDPDETVGELKHRLSSLIHIPSKKQRLVYAGLQHRDEIRCEEVLSRRSVHFSNNQSGKNHRISLYIIRMSNQPFIGPENAGSGYASASSKTIDTCDLRYRSTYSRRGQAASAGAKMSCNPADDGVEDWDRKDGWAHSDEKKRHSPADDDEDSRMMIDTTYDDLAIQMQGPETRRRASMLRAHASHFESYRLALNAQHKDIISCSGDGNCLFRAISHQIYGDEVHHLLVRRKCVEYMSHNMEHFSAACQALRGANGDFQAYLSVMAKDAREGGELAWGDHPEISACAEIYKRQIEIWTYNAMENSAHVQEHCRFGTGYQQNDLEVNIPVRLSFYKGGHYDSIVGQGWEKNVVSARPGEVEDAAIAVAKLRAPGVFDAAIRASRDEAKKAEGKTMDMLIVQQIMEVSERQHVEDEFMKETIEESARKFQEEQDRLESIAVREAMAASAKELTEFAERAHHAAHVKAGTEGNNAESSTTAMSRNNAMETEDANTGITADMKDVMVESSVQQVRNFGCEHFPAGLIKHALRTHQGKEDGVIDIEGAVMWLFSEGERYLMENLHLYKEDTDFKK